MKKKGFGRIVFNMIVAFSLVIKTVVPAMGDEILLDSSSVTGGVITAGVASILISDEVLSVANGLDELSNTTEEVIKDDNVTLVLNSDELVGNDPINEIENEKNTICGELLELDDNLSNDSDDVTSTYLNENYDIADETYLDDLYLASSNTNILAWPVPGTSRANKVRGLTYDGNGNLDHKGLDIGKGINGKTVVAAIEGEVVSKYTCTHNIYGSNSGCSKCYGNGTGLCIKGSDGRYYEYAHMQADSIPQDIEKGTHVSKGQKIGLVGNTGNSSGPHLHFQIATQGEWKGIVDPEKETYDIDGIVPPDEDEYGEDMGDESPYNPEIEDGKYVIMSALRDDLHLNIEGDETADNDFNVNVERGLGGEDIYYDVFKVEELDNGYYKIVQNGTNRMAVSVAGRSIYKEANIQMYYWKNQDISNSEFQWAIKWAGKQDGIPYHYVRARCSGFYMTANGSGNGDNVYQDKATKDDDQMWFFARYMKPSIETDSLPNGSVGQNYSATLEADSDLDVAWTFTSKDDSLPPGLTLERSGKITGTPTTPGTYTFSLDAENALVDALGLSSRKFTITIEGGIPVTDVTLNKESIELKEGSVQVLTPTILPTDATDKTFTCKSSDENVATVMASSGKTFSVKAIKEGTAIITVTSNSNTDKYATCKVTVKPNIIQVTSVSLNKSSLELIAGSSEILMATVLPGTATDRSVTWKSSDDKVATVSSSGKVTAVKEGTATITVTSNSNTDKNASCKVTVKPVPNGIIIKADEVNGAAGKEVSVPVRISNNTGLGSMALTITSDSGLTLSSIEKGSLLSFGTFNADKEAGFVQWYTSSDRAVTGDGVLFTLKFSVKAGAEKKSHPVNISFKDNLRENVTDEKSNILDVTLVPGSVNTTIVKGDVTGDGVVAMGDVVKVARAVAGNSTLTDDEKEAADVTGDKVVAMGDVVKIARYVAGSVTEL